MAEGEYQQLADGEDEQLAEGEDAGVNQPSLPVLANTARSCLRMTVCLSSPVMESSTEFRATQASGFCRTLSKHYSELA